MKKIKTTQTISRLSIILAVVVPLVFIGVVILKNQHIPAGFEIIKFGGIMLAIAIVVWLSVRITALIANIMINWLDKLLARDQRRKDHQKGNNNGESTRFQPKIIDAEIVEEEISDGVWQKNKNVGASGEKESGEKESGVKENGKFEPDWAKATSDPHSALSNPSLQNQPRKKRKRIVGPPSRLTKTIMVVLVFIILFALISNLMSDVWLTLLAPVPGLWAIVSLWRIWDPKNNPSNTPHEENHS